METEKIILKALEEYESKYFDVLDDTEQYQINKLIEKQYNRVKE